MLAKKQWIVALVLGASLLLTSIVEGQLKLPFKKRTSTGNRQNIALTQSDGPWLIMCASFTGEQGVQQALQLATELRNDYGLEAYLYRKRFDHSQKIKGAGWAVPDDKMGMPEKTEWKAKSPDAYDEIAVLVGNFPTVDDAAAQETLAKIKSLTPRSMMNDGYAESHQSLEQQFRAHGGGPLSAAFLLPNPTLPSEYFQARNVDKVVAKMNKGIRYSLLNCPGVFTVRVATFTGERKFNATPQEIAAAERDAEQRQRNGQAVTESALVEAAHKANVLCRALRKKGIEAYEFHDRHESYVCVGSFDWATRPLDNGKDQLNPEIARVIQEFKGETKMTSSGMRLVPRTIKAFKDFDIHFDTQPMPVPVPRLNAKTAQRGLGIFGR